MKILRRNGFYNLFHIVLLLSFLWSDFAWALAPSSSIPVLYRDAAVDLIALDVIQTLAGGEMGDIKVFYEREIEEKIGGDVRCFGIRDKDGQKKGWAFYVVDLDKREIIRYVSNREVKDRFYEILMTIDAPSSTESYPYNKYLREKIPITIKNLPFIKACLDRVYVYPIRKNNIDYIIEQLKDEKSKYACELGNIYGEADLPVQMERYRTLLEEFKRKYPNVKNVLVVRGAGRVVFSGEHSDYHHGRVMNAPTLLDTIIVIGRNETDEIVVSNSASDIFTEGKFPANNLTITEADRETDKKKSWYLYIKSTLNQIGTQLGLDLPGLSILVGGRKDDKDNRYGALPIGAGLSSSAALDTAVCKGVAAILGYEDLTASRITEICMSAENDLGYMCGAQDPFGSIRGELPEAEEGKLYAQVMDCLPRQDRDGRVLYTGELVSVPEELDAILINTGPKDQRTFLEFTIRFVEGIIGSYILVHKLKDKLKGISNAKIPNLINGNRHREKYPPFYKLFYLSPYLLNEVSMDELMEEVDSLPADVSKEEVVEMLRSYVIEDVRNIISAKGLKAEDAVLEVFRDIYRGIEFDFEEEIVAGVVEAFTGQDAGQMGELLFYVFTGKVPFIRQVFESRGFNLKGTVRHVVTEQGRVSQAVEALRGEDLEYFGRIQKETYRSLREDYRCRTPEIDAIIEYAEGVEGTLGARPMAAGWGGTVVIWCRRGKAEEVIKNISEFIGSDKYRDVLRQSAISEDDINERAGYIKENIFRCVIGPPSGVLFNPPSAEEGDNPAVNGGGIGGLPNFRSLYRFEAMGEEERLGFYRRYSLLKLGDRREIERFKEEIISAIRGMGIDFSNAVLFYQPLSIDRSIDKIIKDISDSLGMQLVIVKEEKQHNNYSMITDPSERRRLMEGSMFALDKSQIKGRQVIILDDAVVSGAKMTELVRIARENGAADIHTLAILNLDIGETGIIEGIINDWALISSPESLAQGINNDEIVPAITFIKTLWCLADNYPDKFKEFTDRLQLEKKMAILDGAFKLILQGGKGGSLDFIPFFHILLLSGVDIKTLLEGRSQEDRISFLRNNIAKIFGNKKFFRIKDYTIITALERWPNPVMPVLFAFLAGYEYLVFEDRRILREEETEEALQAAEILGISLCSPYYTTLDRYEYYPNEREDNEKILKDIPELVSIKEEVKRLKEKWKDGILRLKEKKIDNPSAYLEIAEEYSKTVRGVARDICSMALRMCKEKGFINFNEDDLSVIVEGSLSRDTATAGSDIDIEYIAKDEKTADEIAQYFAPFLAVCLRAVGIMVTPPDNLLSSQLKERFHLKIGGIYNPGLTPRQYTEGLIRVFDYRLLWGSSEVFNAFCGKALSEIKALNPQVMEAFRAIVDEYFVIAENGRGRFGGRNFGVFLDRKNKSARSIMHLLRIFQIGLRELLILYLGEEDSDSSAFLLNMPQGIPELLDFMNEKGLFGRRLPHKEIDGVISAWGRIIVARQVKVFLSDNYNLNQPLNLDELPADFLNDLDILRRFIEEYVIKRRGITLRAPTSLPLEHRITGDVAYINKVISHGREVKIPDGLIRKLERKGAVFKELTEAIKNEEGPTIKVYTVDTPETRGLLGIPRYKGAISARDTILAYPINDKQGNLCIYVTRYFYEFMLKDHWLFSFVIDHDFYEKGAIPHKTHAKTWLDRGWISYFLDRKTGINKFLKLYIDRLAEDGDIDALDKFEPSRDRYKRLVYRYVLNKKKELLERNTVFLTIKSDNEEARRVNDRWRINNAAKRGGIGMEVKTDKFENEELYAYVADPVYIKGKDCVIFLNSAENDFEIVKLLFAAGLLEDCGARSITCIISRECASDWLIDVLSQFADVKITGRGKAKRGYRAKSRFPGGTVRRRPRKLTKIPVHERFKHVLFMPDTKMFKPGGMDNAKYIRIDKDGEVILPQGLKRGDRCLLVFSTDEAGRLLNLFKILYTLKKRGIVVTLFMPHFSYMRQHKSYRMKKHGENAVSGNSVRLILKAIGRFSSKVYTANVHFSKTIGYMDVDSEFPGVGDFIDIYNINLFPELARYCKGEKKLDNPLLVGADKGADIFCRDASAKTGIEYGGFMDKERDPSKPVHLQVRMTMPKIEVRGRNVILLDDVISSGTTIINAALLLKSRGAEKVYVGCVLGEFTKGIGIFGNKDMREAQLRQLVDLGQLTKRQAERLRRCKVVNGIVSTDIMSNETSKVYVKDMLSAWFADNFKKTQDEMSAPFLNEKSILDLYPEEIAWVREHCKRVAKLAEIIASRMGYNRDFIKAIRIAALARDLGKGCSPEMIAAVNDPRPIKLDIIDTHREESIRMLEEAGITLPQIVEDAIRYHHDPWHLHEKYTRVLTEIIFVADQIDALQDTHRPYSPRIKDIKLLLQELRREYKRRKKLISKPVYKMVHRLLVDGQDDIMDVIYEARDGVRWGDEEIKRRISILFDSVLTNRPREETLPVRWDIDINAVDLEHFYRYVSGLEGLGEGEKEMVIIKLLLAIVNSTLDIKGYEGMKLFSDLILLDKLETDAIRSHTREFRNNFDQSGEKSREIMALLNRIKREVPEELRPFVDDFIKRCGYLVRAGRQHLLEKRDSHRAFESRRRRLQRRARGAYMGIGEGIDLDRKELVKRFAGKVELTDPLNFRSKIFHFFVTKRCNADCRHYQLAHKGSARDIPKEKREAMYRRMLEFVKTDPRFDSIAVGGGEPLAYAEDSVFFLLGNSSLPTYLQTNAKFAKDLKTAREVLSRIYRVVRPKLDSVEGYEFSINTSLDTFHQERIPLENVANLIQVTAEEFPEMGLEIRSMYEPEIQDVINRLFTELRKRGFETIFAVEEEMEITGEDGDTVKIPRYHRVVLKKDGGEYGFGIMLDFVNRVGNAELLEEGEYIRHFGLTSDFIRGRDRKCSFMPEAPGIDEDGNVYLYDILFSNLSFGNVYEEDITGIIYRAKDDPITYLLEFNPFLLLRLTEEIKPDFRERVKDFPHPYSIIYEILRSPSRRLYITKRLIQIYAVENKLLSGDFLLGLDIPLERESLVEEYRKNFMREESEWQSLYRIYLDGQGRIVKTDELERRDLYNEQYVADALGVLVSEYGPGIVTGLRELDVVDADGPVGGQVDNKAVMDIDVWRDKNLVLEVLEHEALHEILGLILPDNLYLSEAAAEWYSAKRFSGLSPEEQDNIIRLTRYVMKDNRHAEFLEYIKTSGLKGDDLIGPVIAYLGVKGIGPLEVKSASVSLHEVIILFNDLAGAVRGEVKEVEADMLRVIRTFNGIRVKGKVPDRVRRLIGYLVRNERLDLPESADISRPRYIVVNKDRKKNRLEDILKDKYNIHVVTEIPRDGEFVVLVDPEDVGNWSNESFLYLPLPYMEQSLKLAAGMLLSNEEIAHNYLNGFYNILLGRRLTDDEVSMLFHKPWWILPEIKALANDLSILYDAISQLEKSV